MWDIRKRLTKYCFVGVLRNDIKIEDQVGTSAEGAVQSVAE